MSLTENEIFDQYEALEKTCEYLLANAPRIKQFYQKHKPKSLAFIGCGSSLCQCRSAEMSAKIRLPIPAVSIAGGDLLVNYPHYKKMLKGTMLIAPTRSGTTSEVVLSIKKLKKDLKSPCICVCCRENSELSKIADLALEIPWAFDESVCQTRSVTNIYSANLLMIAAMAGDQSLFREVSAAIKNGPRFILANQAVLRKLGAQKSWDNVVVLADSELEGIGGSAALHFKEIAIVPAPYYHILDVRHGPVVLIDKRTLVVMACSPFEIPLQKDLVKDLRKRGAFVLTISPKSKTDFGSDLNLRIPAYNNHAVSGIPFIFAPQLLSCCKGVARGLNPDLPRGLDPWIVLKGKN
jgi:glutamine---fructose-6-phosphate transaminase (isomerizing)